ncbi:hypothetical protein YC2023_051748 [Brassica napus]
MAVTTLLYSHGNAADIFQMYELTIQLRKWVSLHHPVNDAMMFVYALLFLMLHFRFPLDISRRYAFLIPCLHLLNTTNKRLVSPVFLHHDSVINLLARKSRRPLLILSTVDHLGGVLFTLYRSPMTISLTGNSNIKPVNVSQALTAGLLQFLLNEKCFFEPLSICQNS